MQTTLYYRQGTSDKVYVLEKAAEGSGFIVKFGYGRRGSTLKYGTKTAAPVDEKTADKVFGSVFKKQVSEGYTDDPSGVPFTPCVFDLNNSSSAAQVATAAAQASFTAPVNKEPTGINVQLLNPIDEAELDSLFQNDEIGVQEKFDGKRMVLVLDDNGVYGVNRLGLRIGIPVAFETALKTVAALCKQFFNAEIFQLMIDGEAVGENYVAFDLLELNKIDYRGEICLKRWERLKTIVYAGNIKQAVNNLFCSDLITGEAPKRAFFETIKKANCEGVVFKNLNSPYEAGRPNSGGNQLKYKFCAQATCLVGGHNKLKRSVQLQVLGALGQLRDVGNCTITANFDVPPVGALVEVRYLYAFRDGSLYQPVYQGERTDKQTPDEHSSLKFKAETDDGE